MLCSLRRFQNGCLKIRTCTTSWDQMTPARHVGRVSRPTIFAEIATQTDGQTTAIIISGVKIRVGNLFIFCPKNRQNNLLGGQVELISINTIILFILPLQWPKRYTPKYFAVTFKVKCSQTHRSHCSIVHFPLLCQKDLYLHLYFDKNHLIFEKLPLLFLI